MARAQAPRRCVIAQSGRRILRWAPRLARRTMVPSGRAGRCTARSARPRSDGPAPARRGRACSAALGDLQEGPPALGVAEGLALLLGALLRRIRLGLGAAEALAQVGRVEVGGWDRLL